MVTSITDRRATSTLRNDFEQAALLASLTTTRCLRRRSPSACRPHHRRAEAVRLYEASPPVADLGESPSCSRAPDGAGSPATTDTADRLLVAAVAELTVTKGGAPGLTRGSAPAVEPICADLRTQIATSSGAIPSHRRPQSFAEPLRTGECRGGRRHLVEPRPCGVGVGEAVMDGIVVPCARVHRHRLPRAIRKPRPRTSRFGLSPSDHRAPPARRR